MQVSKIGMIYPDDHSAMGESEFSLNNARKADRAMVVPVR